MIDEYKSDDGRLTLRPYQEQGRDFLKAVHRGMLTDLPGMGKTIQASEAAELPAMIICPKYLTGQWADFLTNQYPDTVVAHADGTRTMRDKILSKRADWYIVNLEMIHTYDMPVDIRTYVNDESHHLRNRTATQSKAAYVLENRNPESRIYHLSATPMWKTVGDIWMQLHILYPKVFASYGLFLKLYCVTTRGPYGPKILGVRAKMRKPLRELLAPLMYGRTYAQVGRYLPSTIENIVLFELDKERKKMYNDLKTELRMKYGDGAEGPVKQLLFSPMTVLHPLRQITAHSGKMDVIENILEDNNDKPTVIGFWYKDHARLLHARLGNDRSVLVTGDLDATTRHRVAMQAQRDGKHIIASQAALAEGINLHQYRMFIFGEENYVPGSNHQFLSRVVRDRNDGGLDRDPVRVYYVHARRTVDQAVHKTSVSRAVSITNAKQLIEEVLKKDET